MTDDHHKVLYDARKPFGGFVPPTNRRWPLNIAMGMAWFFVFYRIKHDGFHNNVLY